MPFWPEQSALKIRLAGTNRLKNELRSQFHIGFCMSSSLQTPKSNAVNNVSLQLLPQAVRQGGLLYWTIYHPLTE